MPGFASFFKGQMPGAVWLTSMSAFLRKCKHGTSSSSIGLSPISDTFRSPSGQIMKRGGHLRDESDLELDDTQCSWDSDSGSVGSVIQEEGDASRNLEEVIVRMPCPVYQSMRR